MRAANERCTALLLLLCGACASAERPVAIGPVAEAASEAAARFASAGEKFETQEACVRHLGRLVQALPKGGYEIARGPYRVADGDMRIHGVRAEPDGHVVLEYRCRSARIEARSWKISAPA